MGLPKTCHVVVVAETPGEIEKFRRLLDHPQYKCTLTTTVDETAEAVAKADITVVVYLLSNPGPDGIAAVTAIRKINLDLPIVVVSLTEDDERIIRLLEAGASEFFHHAAGHAELLFRMIDHNHTLYQHQLERETSRSEMDSLNRLLKDNLQILENDQWAGYRVQRAMMPPSPELFDGLSCAYHLFPTLILSGDFVDYFQLPDNRLLFYIADVSGHGASSAFVTVLLKSLMRKHEFDSLGMTSVGDKLTWLNREIHFCQLQQHVTLFLAIVDPTARTLEYANAAQFPGAMLRVDDQTKYLETGNLPLGLSPVTAYDSRVETLGSQFEIVLFSDGVFEIMSEQTLAAKEDRLLQLVECHGSDIDALVNSLGIEAAEAVPDDIAVLALSETS